MKTAAPVVLLVATLARSACAQTWAEVGDAGDLPGTAQTPIGVGLLTSISGTLGPNPGNADMYLITISNPAAFSAIVDPPSSHFIDSQIFLFTTTGIGIAFNDDFPTAAILTSSLPAGNPLYAGLAPGTYMLALSSYNNDPISAGGAIFPGSFPGVFGPTGPGGSLPVTSWAGGFTASGTGRYTIILTGASFVPGPALTPLLGLAVLACPSRRRMNGLAKDAS